MDGILASLFESLGDYMLVIFFVDDDTTAARTHHSENVFLFLSVIVVLILLSYPNSILTHNTKMSLSNRNIVEVRTSMEGILGFNEFFNEIPSKSYPVIS